MNKTKYILIWVDHFERFYLMPVEAWGNFQSTVYHNILLSVAGGYSEHFPGVDMNPIAEVKNQSGDLITDLEELLGSMKMRTRQELLTRYRQVKDDLLDVTEDYHDAMLFDIEGYEYAHGLDSEELQELENRIVNFEQLLECLKKIEYTYA
jgi:hypothetical protein